MTLHCLISRDSSHCSVAMFDNQQAFLKVLVFVNRCYKKQCCDEKYGNPTDDERLEDYLHVAASQIYLNINTYFSD